MSPVTQLQIRGNRGPTMFFFFGMGCFSLAEMLNFVGNLVLCCRDALTKPYPAAIPEEIQYLQLLSFYIFV